MRSYTLVAIAMLYWPRRAGDGRSLKINMYEERISAAGSSQNAYTAYVFLPPNFLGGNIFLSAILAPESRLAVEAGKVNDINILYRKIVVAARLELLYDRLHGGFSLCLHYPIYRMHITHSSLI